MPDNKQPTPAMRALKSVAPSIRAIGAKLGQSETEQPRKKKKLFTDNRSIFNPKKIYDDTVEGLSGLKYLNPANRPKR